MSELVITRTFDAPRDLVWKALSEADRLAQWWGPKGFTVTVSNLDFRPGGDFHYCMTSQGGQTMWGKFIYREIDPQDRIVFVNSFSDESGGMTRAPFFKVWPLEILNTLTLTEENGKTTITLRGGPINATEEEMEAFEANVKGMEGGFAGTFDQLDTYLAKVQEGAAV